jgi:hypothetical protein
VRRFTDRGKKILAPLKQKLIIDKTCLHDMRAGFSKTSLQKRVFIIAKILESS